MATTDNIAYGASTAITCTMTALASSATAGRSCVAIDNGTNKFVDAMLTIKVATSAAALANDLACYVYLYGSEDGTTYGASSAEAVGTDVAVTLGNPTNMRGPYVIATTASSVTYPLVIGSIASVFGGVLPRKWGYVIAELQRAGARHRLQRKLYRHHLPRIRRKGPSAIPQIEGMVAEATARHANQLQRPASQRTVCRMVARRRRRRPDFRCDRSEQARCAIYGRLEPPFRHARQARPCAAVQRLDEFRPDAGHEPELCGWVRCRGGRNRQAAFNSGTVRGTWGQLSSARELSCQVLFR